MSAKLETHGWFSPAMLQPLDWLLLAVPAAFAIRYVSGWKNETLLFIITGIAIIPLAGWMGRTTEHLGARAGHGVGGLLNATFGNAAELIIALMALSRGLTGVVKVSVTGSIIGNILLVLGASILAGGMRFHRQTFNQTAARISSTSLSLAAIGLIIPTIFHLSADRQAGGWSPQAEQNHSMAIAAVLFIGYILSLVFSLITHKALFAGEGSAKGEHGQEKDTTWSVAKAITILAMSTTLVAFMSEFLVGSVEVAREKTRADGSVRRRHHCGVHRKRGRAFHGRVGRAQEQDGLEPGHCHRFESANRAVRDAGAGLRLLPVWPADEPGVFAPGNRRRRAGRLDRGRDKRRL